MSDTPHTTRQCYKKVKLNAMLILVVKFGVYSMAKTRGARDIDESQQKAIIEDRKQGMHKELAQQFSISKSALTKLLKRWKRGYIKKKKPGDRVALFLLSITTSSANRAATYVLRHRILPKKYYLLENLIHPYRLYVIAYRLEDCMDGDP